MKTKFIISILSILLIVACAPQQKAITSQVSVTFTLAPTKTVVPTNTSVPTETPDPLAGAPEGTTKIGNDGQWIKDVYFPKTNKTVEFEYTKIVSQDSKVMFEGWTNQLITSDGVPLAEYPLDYLGFHRLGNVYLACSDGLDGCGSMPKFEHVKLLLEDADLNSTLTAITDPMIYKRLHDGVNPVDAESYYYYLQNKGQLDIPFYLTTPDNILHWKMSPDIGSISILTNWDDLDGAQEYSLGGRIIVRTKILGVSEKGELVGLMATNIPVPSSDIGAWTRIAFLQSSMVIQQPNINDIPSDTSKLTILDKIVTRATREDPHGHTWITEIPEN